MTETIAAPTTKVTLKALHTLTGGLSVPSKMPCHSFSISPNRCNVGSKLRKIEDSTCSDCYACKGRYLFENVEEAMERRYTALMNTGWVGNMIELISRKEKSGFFRWHDAGDLQSIQHLIDICEVTRGLPDIKFWLPTREKGILIAFKMMGQEFPSNLTVRLSDTFVDDKKGHRKTTETVAKRLGIQVSGVSREMEGNCPAPTQGNVCGDCRDCWDKEVFRVDYHYH
jgi:hypothetical protein